MIDHHADLKKYVPAPNDMAVAAIIKHLGIALKGTDSALVACSSKHELDRIRESWLKKKLGLANPDGELDAAIQSICSKMKDDNSKSRLVFYYLLAEKYGRLAVL